MSKQQILGKDIPTDLSDLSLKETIQEVLWGWNCLSLKGTMTSFSKGWGVDEAKEPTKLGSSMTDFEGLSLKEIIREVLWEGNCLSL